VTNLRKIYSLLTASEHREAFFLLGLMTAAAVLETFGVGLVVPALAILLQSDPTTSYPALRPLLEFTGGRPRAQVVATGMLVFVAVYLAKAVFVTFVIWRQNKFVFALHARLSQLLFQIYLRQPYTFHLQRNSAQLIHNLVARISDLAFNGVMACMLCLTDALVLAGIAALLLIVQPAGALLVGASLGAAAWGFQRATRARLVRWGTARPHHEERRLHHLQQGLGGAKEVKLLGREEDFLAQYRFHSMQSGRLAARYQTALELPRLGLELLGVVALAALVLTMLAQGREMTGIVLTLGLFAAAAFRLMPSVNRIVSSGQRLRYVGPTIETLYAELTLPAPDAEARAVHSTSFDTDIKLDNIGYTYPSSTAPALDGVVISLGKNECVGFVGPSGSGKSTLVDVILGLLTPDAGQVLVDGLNIQHDLRSWQNQVGYVPQSIYLTDDTLRRNVAFGLADEDINGAAVERAVKAAQLEGFVADLPDGLETVVGERGVRLSGGERQRIGIARALYHDPPVLVLDEATSALDGRTERRVMQDVIALRGTKTILVVAHRLSTVEHCDRLYRLEHGKVVAEGASGDVLRIERAIK
jgi:ABC-type multidrug transport system fused ATPase/permease subunit